MKIILSTAVVFLFFQKAFSSQSCVSGNAAQNNIVTQLENAKKNSSITQKIFDLYKLDTTSTEAAFCTGDCASRSITPIGSPIEVQKIPRAPQLLFKNDCLHVSNQVNADTAEVSCPDGVKSKNRNLCITDGFLKYQNAAISNFFSCALKEGFTVPSPAALYQMYSLETGFKPQYSYNGGVGVGQLTRIFVEDIHQRHRGFKFMKKIADSTHPECAVAKLVAQKDLHNKPSIQNSCNFISVGNGLERNILYSLIGFANSWEKDISPKLRHYIAKYPNHRLLPEIKDMSLLNAYGPGGRAAARATIARLSHLPPEDFTKAMKRPLRTSQGRNLTVYTSKIEAKKNELAQQLNEPLKSQFAQRGAGACIHTY